MLKQEQQPEYRFFSAGLLVHYIGAVVFCLIYVYYYKGGDTMRYFESSVAYANLFLERPGDYFSVLTGPSTEEARAVFDSYTGKPYQYLFTDSKTNMVVKLVSPLVILTGKSYFLSSTLLAIFSFYGVWRLFQTFYRYFPNLGRKFAISILFMPSVVFWGSGILKDTFTLAGTCLFVYAIDQMIIRKNYGLHGIVHALLGGFLIISIKPYIFLILLPGTLFWVFFKRISAYSGSLFKFFLLPIILVVVIIGSVGVFSFFSSSFEKFSIDQALETAAVTQNDLKQEYYDGSSFDIGSFDGSIGSAVRLMPNAILAGLFRPFLWDARSIVTLFAAIENTVILLLFLGTIIRIGPLRFIDYQFKEPIAFFCIFFAIYFAFTIGLSTSNFGALIRFKIPLVPFFLCGLFIIREMGIRRRNRKKKLPLA